MFEFPFTADWDGVPSGPVWNFKKAVEDGIPVFKGFRVEGSGFRDLGFRVEGSRFRDLGFMIQGL